MRRVPLLTSWLLLASFSAAAAQPAAPPWSVEAPGAAGATFGLGLDGLFEQQESLDIESSESTITVQEREDTIPSDPDLLNRKFDMRWDLEGIGAQLPIALPSFGRRLYPTLIFQAASVDVALDFLDRSREGDSTSLDGQGEIFGGGFDLVAPLGRRGSWYAAGSYRFQTLPDLTVDRSPSFASPGFEVVHDEVQLSRETQDLALRVGYSFPGGRLASYLGARRRWTEIDVEDELRFANSNRQETSLTSRTELESDEVFGFAGLDVHVWGPLYARAETTFGGDDRSTLLKAVYLWPRGPASGSSSGEGPGATGTGSGTGPAFGEGISGTEGGDEEGLVQVGPKTSAEEADLDHRASQIAAAIAPLLAAIEADFLTGWNGLLVVDGPQGPSYRARDVEALLDNTERRLVSVLGEYPELEALKDGVQDEFRTARKELGFNTGGGRSEGTQGQGTLAFATFSPQRYRLQLVQEKLLEKQKTDQALNRVAQGPVATPKRAAQEERLRRTITFRTTLGEGATLLIYPRYNRKSPHAARLAPNAPQKVWLGDFSFEVWPAGRRGRPQCDANAMGPDGMCPLDLLYNVCSAVRCNGFACRLEECWP